MDVLKSKIVKLLSIFIFSAIVFIGMVVYLVQYNPSEPTILILTPLLTSYATGSILLFLIILEIFKKIERQRLLFKMILLLIFVSVPLITLLIDTVWSSPLLVSMPLLLISFVAWVFYILLKNNDHLLLRVLKLNLGILSMIILTILLTVLSAFYIKDNYKKYGYPSWTYEILRIPETIEYEYFYRTGKKYIQKSYLKSTTPPIESPGIYLDYGDKKIANNQNLTVSKFKSGKIAFIKNNNLWLSEGNGDARAITTDGGYKATGLFTASPTYRYPIWSPEGKNLIFIQNTSLGGSSITRHLVTDGNLINLDSSQNHDRFPSFWLSDDDFIMPGLQVFRSERVIFEKEHSGQRFDFPDSPFFGGGFNIRDGCGGGGRPEWSYKLSKNHLGAMDGIRASFFYLKSIDSMVYSSGCENEVSLLKVDDSEDSKWFDRERKPYYIVKSLDRSPILGTSFLFKSYPNDLELYYGPQELMLSHDKKFIIGTDERKIILYDSSPKFVKTLWDSGKAYGPVFSSNDKFVYFADNFKSNPELVKINLDTEEATIVFKSKYVGAISNISPSPDDSEIAFTLIKETIPMGSIPDNKYDSKADEDIYIVSNDGQNLRLFAENASQPAWGLKYIKANF